jgi:UDP-N-acetylglucosamine:LPS N-acetylglucosamine transferase
LPELGSDRDGTAQPPRPARRPKTICIVSGGGHIEEAAECFEAFRTTDIVIVVYRHHGEMASFSHPRVSRVRLVSLFGSSGPLLYLSLAVNLLEFFWIFLRERPTFLFSTGSEIAIGPFILGKLLWRTRNVFLETVTRIHACTVTAHWVYRWCDLFLVQWPHQTAMFGPRARYEGRVL